MGKITDHAEDWLSRVGYDLGYHILMLPALEHFDIVEKESIPVWKYQGYKTERGFLSSAGWVRPYRSIADVIKSYGMDTKKYWKKDELGGIINER
tara:strand:- start:510 stop:794 length:285 start_codon:yes stop_codon:yes gene_type:complete